MKRPFLTAGLGALCVSGFAQGTIDFSNMGPDLAAKITHTDGTPLFGYAWYADLFWAPGIVADSCALQPLNAPANFSTNSLLAGYFFGGTRTLPVAPGSMITAQVRVWAAAQGTAWLDTQCFSGGVSGESVVFQATLADQNSTNYLTGLNGHGFQTHVNNAVLVLPALLVSNIVMLTNTIGFTLAPAPYFSGVGNVVVEATTNLTNPVWTVVQGYGCIGPCPVFFTDFLPTNSPTRFYRVGWFIP